MRTITIKPALNGYICTVGCQTVVFESRTALLQELESYLKSPDIMENDYLKKALNPMESQPPQAVATDPVRQDVPFEEREYTVPDRPQTLRERALAGTLPAETPPLNSRTP